VRQAGHNSSFHRRRSGTSEDDRHIVGFRPRHKGSEQFVLDAMEKLGKFRLAMANVRALKSAPHSFAYVHRTGIE
jgi:hypothetical protein